jgi:hypothetical protein
MSYHMGYRIMRVHQRRKHEGPTKALRRPYEGFMKGENAALFDQLVPVHSR